MTSLSRTLITLVRITFPACANIFGTAPCTASGVACYNTLHTCKDRLHYTAGEKTFSFCSADAPLPFPGPRPYIRQVTYLPTEITTNLTKTGRIKVEFADEPDSDIGIDPYVTTRSAFPDIPGTFFKRLIARNPNYKGCSLEIAEGELGQAEGEYVTRAHVLIETGTVGKGSFTFESIDLLAGLGEIEIPPKTNIKLLGAITAADVAFVLADTSDVANLETSGWLRIDDEIIEYTGYVPDQRQVTGCTRGTFGTVADSHNADNAVQPCRYFAPGNPFDHLQSMLIDDAGYDFGLVDSVAFDGAKAWPGEEVPMSALISQPTKLNEIYMGLVDLLDCKSWVAENLMVTIARNIANAPGRTYAALSDAESIIKASASVDLNEVSRKTRTVLYWERSITGDPTKPASYSRIDIGVHAEAEAEYGDTQQETLLTPWITAAGIQDEVLSLYLSDLLLRRMFNKRDAAPLLKVSLDHKDAGNLVGDYVTITTDELANPDGTPLSTRFQVVKRDAKASKLDSTFQRMPARRCMFYTPEGVTDYTSATPAQREYGGFYCDDLGKMPDGSDGFFYY